ncbi:MAG: diacylglycerol kinase family lipid kinase [Verrucomicrobiales bacterium]|nr:diacylglycerol kinase family lipid kinase [Verrucomicrobiales bacterium]
MTRTCIIFNPTARGDKAASFRAQLDSLSVRYTLRPTDAAGAARRMAREAVQEGFEVIVAAGGDGTVNEVVNGISDHPDGWVRASLGILPLGTVNVFAKELGIPADISGALALLREGHLSERDLPLAEFSTSAGIERRCFVQLAGAGLDSRAIARVRWNLKKRLGPLAYVIAGLGALRENTSPIQVASAEKQMEGGLILIGKGRYYGGRYILFPQAVPDDGYLEVVVYPRVGLAQLAGFGFGWLAGNLHRFTGAVRWKTRAVTLSCRANMPFELEGDNVGDLPVTFRSAGRRMRVWGVRT